MKILIEEHPASESWIEAGDWLKKFIELGIVLGRVAKSPSFNLTRLMIVVPKKEFVSPGIALGASIQRFVDQESQAKEISMAELANLPAGTHLRLEWPQGPRDVIFLSYTLTESGRRKSHRMKCDVQGPTTFDIGNVKRILILPDGFPQGDYLERDKEPEEMATGAKHYWKNQEAPSIAIFGDLNHFQEQVASQLIYDALVPVTGSNRLTFEEAARVDYLSQDRFAHFINIFEQVNEFPERGSENATKVGLCDWILLDGNNATQKLAGKEDLIDKRVISIVELGVPRLQGKAFDSFLGELNNLEQLNPRLLLNWQPPAGVHIWGWGR